MGRNSFELPTIGVAAGVYAGFLVLTWNFASLPLWVAVPCGALLLAWHGSLQHETIHGHPTPWRRVNALIGWVPLSLWVPYALYRQSHRLHHRFAGRYLTDPLKDPESFYLEPGTLRTLGKAGQILARANCTLAGRLALGPLLSIGAFIAGELEEMGSGDRQRMWIWLRHTGGVVAVLGWVVGVCHIPAGVYVGLFIYPATAITLLRSFAEHRAHVDPRLRTAVVQANPLWSLIFLNNNLHIAHHALPDLPWYELPAAWRRMQATELGARVARAGLVIGGGYLQLARAYLARPIISVEHPILAPGRD